ncbi:MAG: M13 family peptidase, partial [Flavobacteriaceae bacterium]|nr:M13 family peptidase [Flavobacteriaceae bacterium]
MKKNMIKGSLGFLFLLSLLNSCKSNQEVAKTETKKTNPGINTEYMDTSVSPSNDFFRYVNGKWLDKTEIPADRTRWGSFDELRKNTDDDVMAILKEALADKTIDPNSDQGKALSLYKSVLDTITRNKMGISPLKPYLSKIDK